MNKQEFAIFASAIRTYYPKEKLLPNEQAMALWYEQLKDIPFKVAEATLNKWVATNKWSPSIADIREQVAEVTQAPIKDWGEAWDDVQMSVRLYGSYEVKKAMESLDDITRQAVKRVGYLNICMSENIATERANFRMIYEQLANRKRQDAQLPPQLKQLLASMPMFIESEGIK